MFNACAPYTTSEIAIALRTYMYPATPVLILNDILCFGLVATPPSYLWVQHTSRLVKELLRDTQLDGLFHLCAALKLFDEPAFHASVNTHAEM